MGCVRGTLELIEGIQVAARETSHIGNVSVLVVLNLGAKLTVRKGFSAKLRASNGCD
jgi:hypothetical protein